MARELFSSLFVKPSIRSFFPLLGRRINKDARDQPGGLDGSELAPPILVEEKRSYGSQIFNFILVVN